MSPVFLDCICAARGLRLLWPYCLRLRGGRQWVIRALVTSARWDSGTINCQLVRYALPKAVSALVSTGVAKAGMVPFWAHEFAPCLHLELKCQPLVEACPRTLMRDRKPVICPLGNSQNGSSYAMFGCYCRSCWAGRWSHAGCFGGTTRYRNFRYRRNRNAWVLTSPYQTGEPKLVQRTTA